jgi:hypothetical protein
MAETQTRPRGRKPVENKDAPHGMDDQGKPNAPFGYLANGKPRVSAPATVDVEALSLDLLNAPEDVPAELVKKTAPARARDEKQQAMDRVVSELHQEWIDAGSPSDWDRMPKKSYPIPASAVEGLKKLVTRAGDFHGLAIKWGTPIPTVREVRNPRYGQENQPATVKAQLVLISFAAKTRRERKASAQNGDQK